MNKKLKSLFLAPLVIISLAPSLHSQLYSLNTDNLRLVYYDKLSEYLVPHIARCFENALKFHSNLFQYVPSEDVTILMQDLRDFGHGGAEIVPKNVMYIGIAPFNYVYETMPANERMNWMMNHELVHIVTMDQAAGADNFFRALFFGKVSPTPVNPVSMFYSYLTNPRRYTPRWYLEGSAVFLETWMAGGLGRALGAYDEMVFRTVVRDGRHIYDVVGLESEGTAVDFQVGVTAYLYGTRFMSYLALHYGPENLLKWITRSKDSKRYFASQFRKIFGRPLDVEWSRWIEWERNWQIANLDSIRSNPTTPYRPISRKALGSISRTFFDAGKRKLYAAIRYPGQVAQIGAIDMDTGTMEKICDVRGAALYYVTSLAYDESSNTLFYTTDNYNWRDLKAVDINNGRSKTLIKDLRMGDIAFNRRDKSIWGVRHFVGLSTLVRVPYPYKEWDMVFSLPYGTDLFDLDISPDGQMLSAAQIEISGRQKLIKMDIEKILNGDTSHVVLIDFENSSPANFVFSPDGMFLYGSSYYSGVSNIYRYDLTTKQTEIVSNCETGFFRPVPVSDDSLIVMRYTGSGFVPVMIPNQLPEQVGAISFLGNEIAEKHPIVKAWTLTSPRLINLDSLNTYYGTYSSVGNISLNSAYPVIQGYKDAASFGMYFNFSDKLRITGFDITTSYSPDKGLADDERFHVGFNLQHWQWTLSATYNGADFYDLFGPTKTSRKGYSLSIERRKTLLSDDPKRFDLSIKLAGYGGLERLPDFQNISASFEEAVSLSINLNYENQRKSLGAVEEELGVKWRFSSFNNYVNSEIFPRLHMNLDYGFLLPINHSSIWLRNSVGHSFGDREEPFANFFFGGFGNNWVDFQAAARYREFYSFPGVELNEIGGINYAKTMLEWNLPPVRFRRFGITNLYMRWARLSLFSTGIVTNFDSNRFRRELLNFGGQIDFRLILFTTLRSTFSIGYAAAVEEGRLPSTEFMVSLKIL